LKYKGQLITFSGIDGAGKSTQINLLIHYLKKIGKKPVYLWSRPGDSPLFNMLKSFLRLTLGKRIPPPGPSKQREIMINKYWIRNIWVSVALFDLALVYGVYVRLLILLGKTIVADRYLWDSWIDFKLNFPEINISERALCKLLEWIACKPDKTFLLLIPVKESLIRSIQKNEPFPDTEHKLRKRLEFYRGLNRPSNCYLIDCMQPIKVVEDEIKNILIKKL
jgi:dTMP kinase|tara:strand:+ start:1107 stop:1772 length:666 start_codon:yes stop_codon:yes gene_type:complete